MSTAITFNQVGKVFAQMNRPALENISLDVGNQEILALVGESGCGKTTLLRLAAGLSAPDSGQVLIRDRVVAGRDTWIPPEKRSVGLVFQEGALFPHKTVDGNMRYGLKKMKKRDQKERVEELLSLIGLEGYGQRYPHELSGGERQRLALARALAPRPDILLLDEPFSNLDVALRRTLREEVRRILKSLNTPAIFVVHDPDDALSTGDRIAILNQGRLEQVDTPFQTYHHPGSAYAASLFGPVNEIPVKGSEPVRWARPEHLKRVKHPGSASYAARIKEIHDAGKHCEWILQLESHPEITWTLWESVCQCHKIDDTVHLELDIPENKP